MMRHHLAVGVVCVLALGMLAADDLPKIEPLEPPPMPPVETPPAGYSERTVPGSDPVAKYKLFIPSAYAADAKAELPLLVHHNPSGRTNIRPYTAWAEKHGVIVLGIDGISNGKDTLKPRIWDATFKDLAKREVRVHPTLKLTIGMSGGSADGMRLARRKPETFAGCVFMGAGNIITNPKAKHMAYAILGGAKDEWMPGNACYAMVDKAREQGNPPPRVEIEIDRQHKEAPLARQLAALSWLLEFQKLQMPTLPEAQRKANLEAAHGRMKNVAKIIDAAERLAEAELLLALPPLEQFREDYAALAEVYVRTLGEMAGKMTDPRAAYAAVFTGLRGRTLPDAAAKEAEALLKKHAAAEGVGAYAPLLAAYAELEEKEIKAGLQAEPLAAVLTAWEAFAQQAKDDPELSRQAAWRIRVCKTLVETPSTIQKPTKLPRPDAGK